MDDEFEFKLSIGTRRAVATEISTTHAPEIIYRVALEFPKLGLSHVCWDSNAVLGIEVAATRMAAMLLKRGHLTTSADLLEAMLAAWENGAKCESSGNFRFN